MFLPLLRRFSKPGVFSCLLLSLSVLGVGQAQNRLPEAPQYVLPNSFNPVAADFTGDGKADLLSVYSASGQAPYSLGLAIAKSTGGYAAPKTVVQLPSTSTLAHFAGDFNGDGKQDFVVQYSATSLRVYLGNGNGTFQSPKTISLSGCSKRCLLLGTGEINRDKKLDLIVGQIASSGATSVAILLGNGDGTFGNAKTTSAGFLGTIALGDVNGDGDTDLALMYSGGGGGNAYQVLLGNGDGTFRAKSPVSVNSGDDFSGLAIADVNGDGHPDLVTGDTYDAYTIWPVWCSGQPEPSVIAFLGKGDGTFGGEQFIYSGNGGGTVVGADLAGDGRTEVLATNAISGTVSVLSGTSAHTTAIVNYAGGGLYGPLLVADANGDGKPDLLEFGGGIVRVFLNRGNGTFRAPAAIEFGAYGLQLQTSDLNHDGRADLAILGPQSSCQIDKNESYNIPGIVGTALSGAQGLGAVSFWGADQNSTNTSSSLSLGDFNRDGSVDMGVGEQIYFNNGRGSFSGASSSDEIPYVAGNTGVNYHTAAGDLNGDGKADLATVDSGELEVRIGKGDGTFLAPVSYPLGGKQPNAVLVRDVNGDGKRDVVAVNYDTSTISVLLGKGDGTFHGARDFPVAKNPLVITYGDFNSDGKLDLAVASAAEVSVLLGNGDGTFQAAKNVAVAATVSSIVAASLRGNGEQDLLVTGSQQYAGMQVLYGKGNGTFAAPVTIHFGATPTSVVAGDFNGDGATDVAAADAGSTSLTVLYNQGGTHITLGSSNTHPDSRRVCHLHGDNSGELCRERDAGGDGGVQGWREDAGDGSVERRQGGVSLQRAEQGVA